MTRTMSLWTLPSEISQYNPYEPLHLGDWEALNRYAERALGAHIHSNRVDKMIQAATDPQTYLTEHEQKIRKAAYLAAQAFTFEYETLMNQQDIPEKVARDLAMALARQQYNTKLIGIELTHPSSFGATALNQLKISSTIRGSIYNHGLSELGTLDNLVSGEPAVSNDYIVQESHQWRYHKRKHNGNDHHK